ncbi:hypothetical protein ACIHAX_15765 [Nocardia sp. NPDC051929]|uniref:hypothetical protein n=1 Tax=Nocardia sp. NPDC051929 TaxID=3364327 RepID=UPI0037CB9DFF
MSTRSEEWSPGRVPAGWGVSETEPAAARHPRRAGRLAGRTPPPATRPPEQVALFLTEHAPHRRLAVRTVADAGLDISPGTVRATAEQRMLREGLPPTVVAARLGQQAPDSGPGTARRRAAAA